MHRASNARGQAGIGIGLNTKAGCALLDQTPVNNRLYTVQLYGFERVSSSRLKRRRPLIESVCAPTDCSSPEAKDVFYQDLTRLPRSVH